MEVAVYELVLGQLGRADGELDDLLAPFEREAPPASRAVRAVTRGLLAERLGCAAAAVPITRVCEHCGDPNHGRPRLEGAGGPAFGASHSGDRGLVAIADGVGALGIDLEVIRPRADLDRLAARVLDRRALARWRSEAEATALERFLRAWVAKEAYLKATGVGIATDLRAVPASPDDWWVGAVPVSSGYVAALAVPGGAVRIDFHSAGTVNPWPM